MRYKNPIFYCLIFLIVTVIYCCDVVKYPYGARLYESQCADCHMNDGSGLSSLYPNLQKSDIVSKYKEIPCIIRNGIDDTTSIIQMLPMENVSDIEITNIINFILHDMNNASINISLQEVQAILDGCKVEPDLKLR